MIVRVDAIFTMRAPYALRIDIFNLAQKQLGIMASNNNKTLKGKLVSVVMTSIALLYHMHTTLLTYLYMSHLPCRGQ